jgi:hypothetical protein
MAANATTTTGKARKPRGPVTTRTWLIRLGVAVLIGLAVGATGGVVTVNKLEPGRAGSVDSLQLMLDSLARGTQAKVDADPIDSAIAAAEAQQAQQAQQDAEADAAGLLTVPSLLDLEEGEARNTIVDAGLQVGEVQFQPSPKPAGTVLGTFPVSGARVNRGASITLVLSDGRPPADTLAVSLFSLR